MNELYQILKVKPNATQEEIHRSFRHLAKETHPDLNGNDDNKVKRFQEVKAAYDTLSDPEKRARYDAAQVKPKTQPMSGGGPGSAFDNILRDQVLALLSRQIRFKRRRLCDFFVGCVLGVLLWFVIWNRHTAELKRTLSMIKISDPKEIIIILGGLLGFVVLVLCVDTFAIIRIHFKLKKIMKRKG